jgi:hypothetical protein
MDEASALVIRSLKAEIAALKEMIFKITQENEQHAAALNEEIRDLKAQSSVRDDEHAEEVQDLKKQLSDASIRYAAEAQDEISTMRLELAELQNALAQRSAENAQLTLANIDLTRMVRDSRSVFETGASRLIQRQIRLYKIIGKHFRRLDTSYGRLFETCGAIHQIQEARDHYESLLEQNEKTVEYLSRSVALIGDLPQVRPPSARELLESPERVIKLVDAAEKSHRLEKLSIQRDLAETTKSLSAMSEIVRRPPVSRPVAAVLTNLGAVMMQVNEQMQSDHNETMRLLES